MTLLPPRPADGALPAPVAVLFDLDGTLLDLPVDLAPARAEVDALLARAGHPTSGSVLAAISLAAAAGPDGDALRRAAFDCLDRAELAAVPRSAARPGAAALLARLAALAVPIAIVTDNGRACVAPALLAAGLPPVSIVIARDDVREAKPASEGLRAALVALGPPSGPLWWVGDSPRDVVPGIVAREMQPGLPLSIVGVAGGRSAPGELARAGADRVVADLAALVALVG